jgi:lysophospholipid acyltransferase (LPLAT)-like uncharacterized protein
MKRVLDKLMLAFLPWLAAGLIRVIYRCLKKEVFNGEILEDLWARGQQVILVSWHDQLLLMPPFYRGPGATILISQSRDGELIARTVAHFSLDAVRGSSSRGGREALREMIALAAQPLDLALTPDGPKGPRHEVKFGVIQLARASGRPIVPLAFACSHGHRFRSWDRFLLPYPWGRAVYQVGRPLLPQPNESAEDLQRRVQQAMTDNTRAAAEALKRYDLTAV